MIEIVAMTLQCLLSPLFLFTQFSLLFLPALFINHYQSLLQLTRDDVIAMGVTFIKSTYHFLYLNVPQYFVLMQNFDPTSALSEFSVRSLLYYIFSLFVSLKDNIIDWSAILSQDLPSKFWYFQAFWVLVVYASWHMTFKLKNKVFKHFQPIGIYFFSS